MDYYRLKMDDNIVKNPISLPGLISDIYKPNISPDEFANVPEGIVTYYKYSDEVEAPDILMYPAFMVTPDLKKLLTLYNTEITAKSVKAFPVQDEYNFSPEYWVLNIPELECLDPEVAILPNGTVEKLRIMRNAIGANEVFKVKGTMENFIIVSTAVVESILRRKMYGVGFEEVEIR